MASDFFLTQIGGYSLVLGMLALSLMVLAGYGGMVSLAQITVAGVAGYSVAIFGENSTSTMGLGWPWWIVVPWACCSRHRVCAHRLDRGAHRGHLHDHDHARDRDGELLFRAAELRALFNGFSGYAGIRAPAFWGVGWRQPVPFYYLCLGTAVIAYAAVLYGARSTFGLTLQATRDNPRRMRAIGYNVTAHKVFAWFLAGIIAGFAGVLLVWFNGRISPGTIGSEPRSTS